TFLDTLDGEAIAEILKEDSSLKSSVNNWFKKFNLQIDVGPIKDIIHQIVVKQNSLDLDITDVGFGVSQVLPVIIQGFLSKDSSITLIEQPEIHLHPKMQADLADLFIDIAIKQNQKKGGSISSKYMIIETHSEYLLKRLRRRISEKKISSEQVAIYYVEPQEENKSAEIRKIDINEKGAFEWPKDFYTGELADDITEFLSNQI
ncbi:AAA family ATPase, partial [Niastella populi]|uniref:AAA family ATPase n=1 Tax=Niastella populi TaxID=550983 RepID=UPI0013FD7E82